MSEMSIVIQKPARRRDRIRRLLLLLTMGLVVTKGVVDVASPAVAGSLETAPGNGTYMIKVANSGKCLAPRDGRSDDEVYIQQFTCDRNNPSQRFTLTMVGGNSLVTYKGVVLSIPRFKLETFAGKCVTIRPLGISLWTGDTRHYISNNNIFQNTCTAPITAGVPDFHQLFRWNQWQHPWEGMMIHAIPDPQFGYAENRGGPPTTNFEYDYCVTIQNARSDDGAGAFLYDCNYPGYGEKNDTFIFMPI